MFSDLRLKKSASLQSRYKNARYKAADADAVAQNMTLLYSVFKRASKFTRIKILKSRAALRALNAGVSADRTYRNACCKSIKDCALPFIGAPPNTVSENIASLAEPRRLRCRFEIL